jgi:hypothetical protein
LLEAELEELDIITVEEEAEEGVFFPDPLLSREVIQSLLEMHPRTHLRFH